MFSKKFYKSMLVDSDISKEMAQHSALLYYYGSQSNMLEDQYRNLEDELDELKFNLIKSTKLRLEASSIAKKKDPTITELTASIKTSPAYKELSKKVNEAKTKFEHAKLQYNSLKEKGEMIRSMAFFKKQQMEVLDSKIHKSKD